MPPPLDAPDHLSSSSSASSFISLSSSPISSQPSGRVIYPPPVSHQRDRSVLRGGPRLSLYALHRHMSSEYIQPAIPESPSSQYSEPTMATPVPSVPAHPPLFAQPPPQESYKPRKPRTSKRRAWLEHAPPTPITEFASCFSDKVTDIEYFIPLPSKPVYRTDSSSDGSFSPKRSRPKKPQTGVT